MKKNITRKTSKNYNKYQDECATMNSRPMRMSGMKRQIKGLSERLNELPFPE